MLARLEADSIYILREAHCAFDRAAMLWSFGKDSTVLLHLARKSFFGRIPFPLIHCDTGLEMPEVYAFRDQLTREWGLEVITQACPPLEATDASLPYDARVAARKTLGLKEAIAAHGFTAVISGIRRDEEATRAKERVFSPRSAEGEWDVRHQPPEFWNCYPTRIPPHIQMRVHPLLSWTELDIWRYIAQEKIPVAPLYFARAYQTFEGRDFGGAHMRFRSLGERGITWPVPSTADTLEKIVEELEHTRLPERAGRPMGAEVDEASFEKLRVAGYL